MNRKLKIALRHRSSEQGFAIPIAVGMGLVMILVGVTMIVRSQGDQVTASAQKATARGMSAAETGITRIQTLINQNPAIATYPLNPVSIGAPSWINASNIPGRSDCSINLSTRLSAYTSGNWINIDPNDPSQGQFKLINYTYTPSDPSKPNEPSGTAQLTAQGRINQVGSGSTAIAGPGTATSQLQVNIPVEKGNLSKYQLPGMWVKDNINTGDTEAHIMSSCTATPTVALQPGYTIVKTDFKIPDPPPLPTYSIPLIPDPSALSPPVLPRPTDVVPTNLTTQEYEYKVSTITGSFTITPGKKVTIYLTGNISMTGGQKAILHQCGIIPNCKVTDARIYGLSTNGQVALSGNPCISDIFLLAPTYNVTLDGGGQAQGCGGGPTTNGVYWVKSWSGGGGGSHMSLHQTSATWDDVFSLPIKYPPQIAPITNWQRQESL